MKSTVGNPLKLMALISGIIVAIFFLTTNNTDHTAYAAGNVSGYAWSSNIGWISLAGSNYGVSIDPATGVMSGYGWSSNIGWVSFDQAATSGCPVSISANGGCQAYVDLAHKSSDGSANIVGAIRACSVFASGCSGVLKDQTARGDWDGYISMGAGGLKMKADGSFSGYAWGSDVVGWVDFSKAKATITVTAPAVTVTANPTTGVVNVVSPVVSWSATNNPTSCTATGDWKTKPTSATATVQNQAQGVLTTVKTYTYGLTCTYPGGVTASGSATVVVTAAPTACNDGKDSDGDGKIDMNDPGCSSPSDNDETDTPTPTACNDGKDSDGDGKIDMNDPGCSSPSDNDETDSSAPSGGTCTDGIKNQNETSVDTGGVCGTPPGGTGVGGQCSNIVDNPATIGVDESIVTFPPYRKLADGRCLCVSGYVLNAANQCVKPVYQEQ